MKYSAAWTPEQIAELRKLWDAGVGTAEIGRRIGMTKNAVIGKAHRLGCKPRPSRLKRRHPSMRPRAWKPKPPRLVAIGDRICAWPIGHPGERGFRFCDEPAAEGKPYCPEHAARAYPRPKPAEAS